MHGTATYGDQGVAFHFTGFGKYTNTSTATKYVTIIDILTRSCCIDSTALLNLYIGIALNETALTTAIDRTLDC